MDSAQAVHAARDLAGTIQRRPFLDKSQEFRRMYSDLCAALTDVDKRGLPPDRVSVFEHIESRIRKHGGAQRDNELGELVKALSKVLSFYWGGLQRDREILITLLLKASGEETESPSASDDEINYHLSILFREGLVEGEEKKEKGFVDEYKVNGITEKGRRFLMEARDSRGQERTKTTSPAIFISHHSGDKPVVEALVELIRAALDVEPQDIRASSVDGSRLRGGSKTIDKIRNKLLQATAFIAVVTPNSTMSTWVLFELGARWGSDKPLIPLLANRKSAEELKGPLAGFSALSCASASQLHQVLDELAETLSISKRSPATYSTQLERLVKLAGRATKPRTQVKVSAPGGL